MKKQYFAEFISWSILGFAILILGISCSENPPSATGRIIIKETSESVWGNLNIYEIVEIDGVEYLTSSHGGIVALPKR